MTVEELKTKYCKMSLSHRQKRNGWASSRIRKALYEAAHEILPHRASEEFDMCSIIHVKLGLCPEKLQVVSTIITL